MAHVHTASAHDIPKPPLSRPHFGLVIVALLALALVGFGFWRARGPSLGWGSSAVALVGTPGSIRTYGSMPELLQGHTETKVKLQDLPAGPGVVAVGSISGLRGEIAIVRGVPWLSFPGPGERISVENHPSASEGAGFLALADVEHWQSEILTDAVPFSELANLIEERARRAGVDMSGPLPLLIEGAFTSIELNVANGAALGAEKPTEKRLSETAVRASLPSASGTIVGFFANSGGERLLHEGQRLHLHIVLPQAAQVGHLDSAHIEGGARLQLPAKHAKNAG